MLRRWLLPLVLASMTREARPSFVIHNDSFVHNGEPFLLRSGSLHYFRVPPAYWADRMLRMKAMGLNSVTMCVGCGWGGGKVCS